MGRTLGLIGLGLLVTSVAHAEGPNSARAPAAPSAEATCAPASDADADAEDRAFSAALESFARRKAFTERLIAQRNAELFEQAIARQARAAELKRELTERESARSAREFEDALALYLKKRELTRERAAAAGAR